MRRGTESILESLESCPSLSRYLQLNKTFFCTYCGPICKQSSANQQTSRVLLNLTSRSLDGKFKDDIPVPAIANQLPGPTELIDVVRCNCKAVGKRVRPEVAAVITVRYRVLCTVNVLAAMNALTHSRWKK